MKRELGYAGLAYYAFDNLGKHATLTHAVLTRHGGVSQAPFATLNTSFSVGDDPAAVTENRRRIAQTLGVDAGDVVTAQQVHGVHVARIADCGLRIADCGAIRETPTADALITATSGLLLSLRFADCVPVLLYDPVRGAVGIAHAGWKGTVAGIVGRTIQAMTASFGSQPADLLAGIGPSIGPCCYSVDEERAGLVRAAFPQQDSSVPVLDFRLGTGVAYFNLWEANRWQLLEAGVPAGQIEVADLCTACHTEDFYSHRAEHGHTGRFAAVIGLT